MFKRKQKQKITKESKREKRKAPCVSAYEHFCHLSIKFPPFSFLSILERKHFDGPEEKTPGPY